MEAGGWILSVVPWEAAWLGTLAALVPAASTTARYHGWQRAVEKCSHGIKNSHRCSFFHFSFGENLCVRGVNEVIELLSVCSVPQNTCELVLGQAG